MSLKNQFKAVLSYWTTAVSTQRSEPNIEYDDYPHVDLNVVVTHHAPYLRPIFAQADGCGSNNNIVFSGQSSATEALNITRNYCLEQHVPFHIIDMTHPRLFNKQQKETILHRASAHERYSEMFYDTKAMNDTLNGDTSHHDAAMDILDFITQHPMQDAHQNILIIQHYHREKHPNWLYNFLDDVTSYNRPCSGCVLFLNADFS
ncbi:hypothetical protein ACPV5U_27950 [Vibrio mediterranei]